jgi:uncharacterized membrane protein YeaQ/YmgE (transglycosylase-associated protein family)
MLGMMLNEGKKLHGSFSLDGQYREKVDWKTFVWVVIGAFIVLFTMREVPEALQYLTDGRARGKIVMTM